MAITWGAAFEAVPAGSSSPSQGDDAIRNLKGGIEERMKNEHTTYTGDGTSGVAASDWLHKAGSAVAWYQSSEPTTYPNGNSLDSSAAGRLWVDSNSTTLYVYNGSSFDAIISQGLLSISIQGNLVAGTNVVGPLVIPRGITITAVYVRVGTAPTGSGIRIGINKNGSSDILGTATYIQIDAAANSASETSDFDSSNKILAAGDYLTFDLDQVGSTIPGANLSIAIAGT